MMRLQWTSASNDAVLRPNSRVSGVQDRVSWPPHGGPDDRVGAEARHPARHLGRSHGDATQQFAYDAVGQASRHKSRPREHPQCSNILVYRLIGPPKKPQIEPVRSPLASWLGVVRGFGSCIKKLRPARGPPRKCLGTTAALACLSDPIPTYMTVSDVAPRGPTPEIRQGNGRTSQRHTAGASISGAVIAQAKQGTHSPRPPCIPGFFVFPGTASAVSSAEHPRTTLIGEPRVNHMPW